MGKIYCKKSAQNKNKLLPMPANQKIKIRDIYTTTQSAVAGYVAQQLVISCKLVFVAGILVKIFWYKELETFVLDRQPIASTKGS